MRIVPYIRVSTEEQAQSGLGLEAQVASVSAAARRLGAAHEDPVVDDGTSAALALDKRPKLLEALASLSRGDVLLVAKRDRLSRGDPVAMAIIERIVARKKARIVSAAGEGTDGDGPSDVLFRRIIDAFGEYERAMIACRTAGALRAKRARGELAGAVPFGFRPVANHGHKTKRGLPARRLVPVQHEQEAIFFMRQQHDAGASLRSIARALTDQGIPPRRGGRWHPDSVRKILSASGQTATTPVKRTRGDHP